MFDPPDHEESSRKSWPLPLKILLVCLVIIIPMLFVMVTFSPLISKKQAKDYSQLYPLKAEFTKADLSELVENMKKDQEFDFYFAFLDKRHTDQAVREVYDILDKNRSQALHKKVIRPLQVEIESMANFFNNLEYTRKFFASPKSMPMLSRTMMSFIYEEFKLMLVGVSYRSLYDPKFRFRWQSSSLEAALKLEKIVLRLPDDMRAELTDSF